jgi:hypothetical protein
VVPRVPRGGRHPAHGGRLHGRRARRRVGRRLGGGHRRPRPRGCRGVGRAEARSGAVAHRGLAAVRVWRPPGRRRRDLPGWKCVRLVGARGVASPSCPLASGCGPPEGYPSFGPRRPRRPCDRSRARRGGTAVWSCAPEPVVGLRRLREPHRDRKVDGRGATPLAPTSLTHFPMLDPSTRLPGGSSQRSKRMPPATPETKTRASSTSLTASPRSSRRGRTRGRNRQGVPGAGVDRTRAPSCSQGSAAAGG